MQHGHDATRISQYLIASCPLQQLDFDQVFLWTSHDSGSLLVFPKSLVQVHCHAAKLLATPQLILGTLLHILKMSASKSQKLILYTSDVTDAKVITTEEPTTPNLVDNILPSISDLCAGDLHAPELLGEQPVTLQGNLHEPIDLDNLGTGEDNVFKLSILSTKPCLPVIRRSLLAYHDDLFFKASKGDYAELIPEKVIDNEGKQSCVLPVTRATAKCEASGELITMDIKTFTCVSHVHSFGKHESVDSTNGEQLSAVYSCLKLAECTVLSGLQFDPGGYLPGGFVFDPGGFTRLLKS